LFDCIDGCKDSACQTQCQSDYPEYLAHYNEMMSAAENRCPFVCGFETPPPPECVSNADCKSTSKPSCGADGKCGPCPGATGCVGRPEGPNCTPLTGKCGKCISPFYCTDQTVAKVCNSETGACGSCATHNDCARVRLNDPACDADTHACRGCVGNAECPEWAPTCDIYHACRKCGTPSDCVGSPFGPHCAPSGACGPCESHTECNGDPNGDICRSDHTCGTCASNADCAQTTQFPKPTCFAAGTCGYCSDDAGCVGAPGGSKCTHQNLGYENGRCVECLNNADCPNAAQPTCTENVCVP
jgi:hypothetical protein